MLSAKSAISSPPFNRELLAVFLLPLHHLKIFQTCLSVLALFPQLSEAGRLQPQPLTGKKSVPKRIVSYLAHEDVEQRLQVFIVTEVAAEGRRGLAASVHNLQQEQGR